MGLLVRKGGQEFVERGADRAGRTVLGHFPEYMVGAGRDGARRFNLPDKVWQALEKQGPEKIWEANQKFLDRLIRRGDVVDLATPLNKVKPGSYFERELQYLFDKGYSLAKKGNQLLPPKKP